MADTPVADDRPRARRRIPEATVARLPVYLRSLLEVASDGQATISSERLAEMAGVNAAKVRKDLSYLGSYGTRGVGYDVEYLLFQMNRELGLTQDWPVVIVGIGNLGHALANFSGFRSRGFRVVALLDADPQRHQEHVAGIDVRPFDDLEEIVAEHGVAIGVISTPANAAQDVADAMVEAGISSILNFAPTVIAVPDGVDVRKVSDRTFLLHLGGKIEVNSKVSLRNRDELSRARPSCRVIWVPNEDLWRPRAPADGRGTCRRIHRDLQSWNVRGPRIPGRDQSPAGYDPGRRGRRETRRGEG